MSDITYLVILVTLILLTIAFFFFNASATTEIYTLSLHDALPISKSKAIGTGPFAFTEWIQGDHLTYSKNKNYWQTGRDRKSTRLNSSHANISYAVFCLKKKKQKKKTQNL